MHFGEGATGDAGSAAKLYLLAALLAKDGVISSNGKALLKELILHRDVRLLDVLRCFEEEQTTDAELVSSIQGLIENKAMELLEELYSECSLEVAKSLSKSERESRSLNSNKSLIYGEVDFISFAKVLISLAPILSSKRRNFYDLGSGSGRAVMIARLLFDFEECVGIELLRNLHNAATLVKAKYDQGPSKLLYASMQQGVRFIHASLLDYNWCSDADVVFANSTCFEDNLMDGICALAAGLEPGSILITFTKPLPDLDAFDLLVRKRYRMSWGPATVFVHAKKNLDGSPYHLIEHLNLDHVDQPDDDRLESDDDTLLTRDRELEIALADREPQRAISGPPKEAPLPDFDHLRALVKDLD